MISPGVRHLRPRDYQEACALLSRQEAAPIAGGTELFLRMKQGVATPRSLVDITALPGMREIERLPDGTLRLGAAVTISAMQQSPLVAAAAPVLVQASERVAAPQIRNMGSLGGNLCQETMCWWYNRTALWRQAKEPCYKAGGSLCHVVDQEAVCYAAYRSDLAPILMSLEAELIVQGRQGERRMRLDELYSGDAAFPFTLADGELISAVLLRPLGPGDVAAFTKHAHRRSIDYPLVSLAVAARGWTNGAAGRLRIVLGAVSGMPLRVPEAEALLEAPGAGEASLAQAAALVARHAKPVRNVSFGAPAYRRHIAKVLARRLLGDLLARRQASSG